MFSPKTRKLTVRNIFILAAVCVVYFNEQVCALPVVCLLKSPFSAFYHVFQSFQSQMGKKKTQKIKKIHKKGSSSVQVQLIISTSKRLVKHPFAGLNTQQVSSTCYCCSPKTKYSSIYICFHTSLVYFLPSPR